MARGLYRHEGKLVIDVSHTGLEQPGPNQDRGMAVIVSVRTWHRGDNPMGMGSTEARALADLARVMGRTVDDLLADANMNRVPTE